MLMLSPAGTVARWPSEGYQRPQFRVTKSLRTALQGESRVAREVQDSVDDRPPWESNR